MILIKKKKRKKKALVTPVYYIIILCTRYYFFFQPAFLINSIRFVCVSFPRIPTSGETPAKRVLLTIYGF